MDRYREPKLLDVVGCPCGYCGKKEARMLKPEWFVLGAKVNNSPSDHYTTSLCASCWSVIDAQPESFAITMFEQAWKNTLEWLLCNGYFKFVERKTMQ